MSSGKKFITMKTSGSVEDISRIQTPAVSSTHNPLQGTGYDHVVQSTPSKGGDQLYQSKGDSPSTDESPKELREVSLDTIIDGMPTSWFHYRLLALCGLSFCADAMEVTLLAFMSTCAGVEWDLTDVQMASVTSAVFAGEFLGGLFWGPVADQYGRRFSFLVCVFMIAVFGVLSAFSPNYQTLLIFRMVVGFGVGGLTVPFDLLAEFLPSDMRGDFLLKMEYFWTGGSLFVSGLAWAILSTSGWRVLTALTAIPVIMVAVLSVSLLPESPRWLLEQGQTEKAEEVLRSSIQVNGTVEEINVLCGGSQWTLAPLSRTTSLSVPVQQTAEEGLTDVRNSRSFNSSTDSSISHPVASSSTSGGRASFSIGQAGSSGANDDERGSFDLNNPNGNRSRGAFMDILTQQIKAYSDLFKPENVGYSYPLWVCWLCFGFGYYGIILFVARLYNTSGSGGALVCDFEYANVFINAASELVGVFMAIQVVDRIGRPATMMWTFGLSAITALIMGLPAEYISAAGLMVMGCCARAAAVAANGTTWVATPELYPTERRATAHSSCSASSRIGGFLVPYMVQSSASNFTVGVILCLVNIVAAFASMLIPDMTGKDLDELWAKDKDKDQDQDQDRISNEGQDGRNRQRQGGRSRSSGNTGEGGEGELGAGGKLDHLFLFQGVPKNAMQKIFGKVIIHD